MDPAQTLNGEVSLLTLFLQGGWVMYPLLLCSICALAVVVERLVFGMRRSRVIPNELAATIAEHLSTNRFEDLYRACAGKDAPLARIVLTALKNSMRPREELVNLVEFAGKRENAELKRNVGVLGTIAAISPLLGLFGTVVGIIHTFSLIKEHGIGNPALLAGGISQALVATASGIAVAVPAMIFFRFLNHRARSLTLELEEFALEVVSKLSLMGVKVERVAEGESRR